MTSPAGMAPPPPPPAGPATDASLGQRVAAILLDTLIVMIPLFVISGLLFGDGAGTEGTGFEISLTGLPFVLTALVALAYFVVMEMQSGQTLGKKIVGIRVICEKGEMAAGPAVIRNLLRVVDGAFCYLVGFVVALASDKNQRVGDMAASTRVVKAK